MQNADFRGRCLCKVGVSPLLYMVYIANTEEKAKPGVSLGRKATGLASSTDNLIELESKKGEDSRAAPSKPR
jgi:hypothetical protein